MVDFVRDEPGVRNAPKIELSVNRDRTLVRLWVQSDMDGSQLGFHKDQFESFVASLENLRGHMVDQDREKETEDVVAVARIGDYFVVQFFRASTKFYFDYKLLGNMIQSMRTALAVSL